MNDDQAPELSYPDEPDEDLKVRLERMELDQKYIRDADRRVTLAELKVEAVRAGMIDLDGLKLADTSQVSLDGNGSLVGGTELINQLRRAKPWLFSAALSSSIASVPSSNPVRQQHAADMTDDEYRSARAKLIKRAAL